MKCDAAEKDLWRCPKCRRFFANRNQSHFCGNYDLESHFICKDAEVRSCFDELIARVRLLGPVIILPEKTRIALQVRMSFAALMPKRHWLDGHLVLARDPDDPLFRKVDFISKRNWVCHFRITSVGDIDERFLAFVEEAYRVGEQKHLKH